MAELLNKDPFTYQKESDGFLDQLKRFHTTRGTPFTRLPFIGGKQVDLYLLYAKVTGLGGWEKVAAVEHGWEEIQEHFHIPRACTNASQALKNIYIRYLSVYEKVHHFGEEPNRPVDDDVEQGQLSARKKTAALMSTVPLSYNFQQHKLQDYAMRMLGLPKPIASSHEYKKLQSALESGLPNEVDFAFNVCTLLSNEGKHIIKVCRCPRVLNLLLAHVGIFEAGPRSYKRVYTDGWSKCTKRNFLRFWYESVEDRDTRALVLPESLTKNKKGETENLTSDIMKEFPMEDESHLDVLHLGRDLGIKEVEGQRVTQLAMILRNLSFEEENMEALASNLAVFRFLMLCINSRYGNLRQLALDTLGNVALKMVLDPSDIATTQLILRTLASSITSRDKFKIVSGMDMLARLCQVTDNEDVLSENLEARLYEDIVSLLTVHDIQLIVHTLEALYQLSELGNMPCTRISEVPAAVETLVGLVTVEAQSYGPGSLIGIKVVEQVPAGAVQQQMHHQGVATPSQGQTVRTLQQGTPQATTPQRHAATPQTPHQKPGTPHHQQPQRILVSTPQQIQRPAPAAMGSPAQPATAAASRPLVTHDPGTDVLACNWINSYYEWAADSLVTRMEMYAHYVSTSAKHGTKSMANTNAFANCVRVVFPQVEHLRMQKPDGSIDLQYKGLRKRNVPLPFPPPANNSDAQRTLQQRLLSHGGVPAAPVAQGSPLPSAQASPRPTALPTPRGVLHSALQQRLASPPMSPQTKPPISPTIYPTIQQALLNQGGSGSGGTGSSSSQAPSPATSSSGPASPLPTSPTATSKPTTDSNLIKSLLANKVTQNMHRLQQQQQQLSQGQPGQIHPGLVQQQQQAPPPAHVAQEPKPSPRAKKRKASTSPTPTDAKIPAIASNPDQSKPDLPPANAQPPPAATNTPKVEPMEVEIQNPVNPVNVKPETQEESSVSGVLDLITTNKDTTQCVGNTNCNVGQACVTTDKLVTEIVNGVKPALPVCVNGSKPGSGGGKAQEPLINGLCSPAPSEPESDSPNKDTTKTPVDITQMKKDLAISEKISDKKEQISALLSESNKQQLFGLNGVVNHLGNGDCHMALHKDNPMEKKPSGEEKPPPPLENGYLSAPDTSCDKSNGSGLRIENNISGIDGQTSEEAAHSGPTHSSDAQTSVSGSAQLGLSAETNDLRQVPAPPAVQTTTTTAPICQAAPTLPPATSAILTAAQNNVPAPAQQPQPATPHSSALVSQLQAPTAVAPPSSIPTVVSQFPSPLGGALPGVAQQAPACATPTLTSQLQAPTGPPPPAPAGNNIPTVVSQLQGPAGTQPGVMPQGQRVVLVQQNGQQVPMVLQQQGAPVPGQQAQVVNQAQIVTTQAQNGQVVQGQVFHRPVQPGQMIQQQQGQVIQQQPGQMVQQPGQQVPIQRPVMQQAPQQPAQGQVVQQVPAGQVPSGQVQAVSTGQVIQQGQVVHQVQQAQIVQQGQIIQQTPQGQIVQQVQGQVVQVHQGGQVQQGQVQIVRGPNGQLMQQVRVVQQGQLLQGQVIQQGQVMQQGQVVQQGQVITTTAQPPINTQSHLVASLQQPVVQTSVPGVTNPAQGGVVMVSAPQNGQAWSAAPLNAQALTQQVVAAQQLIAPAGQRPVQPALAPQQPRHQMVVVSETQTGTPSNPILQQQLQMPPRATTPGTQPIAPAAQPADPSSLSPGGKSAKKRKLPPKKPVPPGSSIDNRPPSASPPPVAPQVAPQPPQPLRFTCDWRGCNAVFDHWKQVAGHVMKCHFSKTLPRVICQWDACDGLERAKWSFHTHLHDRHLTENILKAAAVKRSKMTSPPPPTAPPTNPPVYPNDAAYQAIRRFTQRHPFPEFAEVKEGPVTKHIRLTSALILRNLARYSSTGRSVIKRHEDHLSYVALSNVESSNALSNCLFELQPPKL